MPLTDSMPTAAKVVSAISLAALGWYASQIVRPLMPDGTDFGMFDYVNVVLGILCGWIVCGSRIGRGYRESISAGLTGVAAMVFWAVFLQSFNEMLRLALERRYQGPVEGLTAVFEIGVDYGSVLLNVHLVTVLVIWAIVTGIVAEWISRRWS